MATNIKPLDWNKNPVYISGAITAIFVLIVISLFYFNTNQNLQIGGVVVALIAGGITFLFYQHQCPHCKKIFGLKKASDEVIKEWEEPKQYNEKTIYYYSDGITQKDVKQGATKTFTARFKRHKDGFNCGRCGETHHKTRDVFLNKNDWIRVQKDAIHKVTTSTKKPKEHHTNIDVDFNVDLFEPTEYKDKSGKRKSIPKSVKMQLWNKYFGKHKAYGKCLVCGQKIHMQHFEAGHIKPASKGGGR